MAKQKQSCKVCNSKHLAQINKLLMRNDSINSISKRYGISRAVIRSHRDRCMVREITEQKSVVDTLSSESLMKRLENQFSRLEKMVDATDEWLQDPEDPNKYNIDPRADEIDVVYYEIDEETGRAGTQKEKATLQELLDRIDGSGQYIVRGITTKRADPRELILKSLKELRDLIKVVYDYTQKVMEWKFKNRAMKTVEEQDAGSVTIEQSVERITERVTMAAKKSDTEKLCKLAELPEL